MLDNFDIQRFRIAGEGVTRSKVVRVKVMFHLDHLEGMIRINL
jgi:hypothetical protein